MLTVQSKRSENPRAFVYSLKRAVQLRYSLLESPEYHVQYEQALGNQEHVATRCTKVGCIQDPGVSLLMLLINVDERAPKIRPRSDTNVDEIGSQSDPSPIFCGDGRGRR